MKYFLDSVNSILVLALVGLVIGMTRAALRRYLNDS